MIGTKATPDIEHLIDDLLFDERNGHAIDSSRAAIIDAFNTAPPSTGPAPLPEATRKAMGVDCGSDEIGSCHEKLLKSVTNSLSAPPAASAQKGLTKEDIGRAWRECGALSDMPPDWAIVFAQNIARALLRESEGKQS
jgi:hypothetical protein